VKLLVDVGNSRVKWGRIEERRLETGEAFPTDPTAMGKRLDDSWRALPRPESVYVSNVAGPDAERMLVDWFERHWNADVRVIRSTRQLCGITNGYEDPLTLGVDRWVGMIGVRAAFPLPACLVDCGTAVTVDLLDEHGRHQGGLIAPGLRLMKDALVQRAGCVSECRGASRGFWGRSTGEGLQSGSLQMVLGLIERSLVQAQEGVGVSPTLILSGGDAELVSAQLNVPHERVPNIVLRGLAAIAETV